MVNRMAGSLRTSRDVLIFCMKYGQLITQRSVTKDYLLETVSINLVVRMKRHTLENGYQLSQQDRVFTCLNGSKGV